MTDFRRAQVDDLESFTDFLAALSPSTSYRRFFTGVSRLPAAHARRLLRSDGSQGAWLAWDDDAVVGHGQWASIAPGAAELALVVADHAQGRGIGRALGTAAMRDSMAAGVRRLELVIQRDNALVRDLIARRWPQRRSVVRDGLLVTEVTLAQLPGQRGPSVVERDPTMVRDLDTLAQPVGGSTIQTQSRR
jgi:GNAT superfamily N-acetyltransferase